ncbi:MAG TPA: hypothetical protein VHU81_06005 [Thermoanaerobaculia bacterium]|jgi:hypothetical protein|nr:hypothetical protein [Thermoanaerobaculia bacterium]
MKKREKKLRLQRDTVLTLGAMQGVRGGDYTQSHSVNTKCNCTDTTDPLAEAVV